MGLAGSRHSKVKEARILMLGLDAAGKSTLLYKLKFNEPFSTIPTIGFNVEMIQAEKHFALTVWDVGGQLKMRKLWCYYFEGADGLVYVIDSANKQHLEEARRQFEQILKNELVKNVPVVVMANKQDLPGALNAEEITRTFNMKKHCSDRDWFVQPCCAITGQGLTEGLAKVTDFVKNCIKSQELAVVSLKRSTKLQKTRAI
ncbi:hypothetical protein NDU88_001168 [Pleurodeles waltl]|uniref:ADP-ribosylation factor-like protein 14 n=1 Tax=Pleurodeles waltl TaxID=8319 RepID=A0AAV7LCB9_PLEWA|nr:hypothetical protein NDU88_001168 [Pleurodeles waltl]